MIHARGLSSVQWKLTAHSLHSTEKERIGTTEIGKKGAPRWALVHLVHWLDRRVEERWVKETWLLRIKAWRGRGYGHRSKAP